MYVFGCWSFNFWVCYAVSTKLSIERKQLVRCCRIVSTEVMGMAICGQNLRSSFVVSWSRMVTKPTNHSQYRSLIIVPDTYISFISALIWVMKSRGNR